MFVPLTLYHVYYYREHYNVHLKSRFVDTKIDY